MDIFIFVILNLNYKMNAFQIEMILFFPKELMNVFTSTR